MKILNYPYWLLCNTFEHKVCTIVRLDTLFFSTTAKAEKMFANDNETNQDASDNKPNNHQKDNANLIKTEHLLEVTYKFLKGMDKANLMIDFFVIETQCTVMQLPKTASLLTFNFSPKSNFVFHKFLRFLFNTNCYYIMIITFSIVLHEYDGI
ncbi:hypothetical protein BpHYR1_027423 [Brachionus plicatilis]|uniref:Uncharacterized protein n=1 Tax=Brachionus plicatilis TaxID=10195 RepID=A0A3M7SS79_BRAPC|nr:hypothetical protein BpHYR1_027423 [Brachionus plicatilis]